MIVMILVKVDAVVKKKIRPKQGTILICQNAKKTTAVSTSQQLYQQAKNTAKQTQVPIIGLKTGHLNNTRLSSRVRLADSYQAMLR